MPIARKVFNAEVILTVSDDSTDGILSDQDIDMAAIEAEVAVNSLGLLQYEGNTVGLRLHLKGEKNGDNQDQDLA